MIEFQKVRRQIKATVQQAVYQTKLILKWNKTDEISVYPIKSFFSKTYSQQERKVTCLFQSQLKISCSYVFYL